MGTCHPRYKELFYPVNYGYVPDVLAGDGEEQDAYILGVDEPIREFEGKVIAVIHRQDDVEEKWVVAPECAAFTEEEIRRQVDFQERFFQSEIRMKKVTVLPYDKAWKSNFEAIKKELEEAVGSLAVGIEHVGSTAVEGMWAKPCIDIDLIIEDASVFASVAEKLKTVGYIHEGDLGIKGREAFRYEDKPHLQKHHLYVCPKDSAELHRHITFRDFLRENPACARRYSQVKKEAARLFFYDMDQYIAYKSPCIEELYRMCGLK